MRVNDSAHVRSMCLYLTTSVILQFYITGIVNPRITDCMRHADVFLCGPHTFFCNIISFHIPKILKTVPLLLMRALRRRASIALTHSRPRQLDGVSGQHHAPAALYPEERTAGTHWIGGWVDLRDGLDTEARGEIHCLCRGSNPVRPVCGHKLY
jgi:hypothetical protein